MERILLHHLEKYCSSQGGPQHGCNWSDSALYSFSQNWTSYSFSRTCSQLWNLSLHSLFASGSFYIGKGKEVTGTEGVESVREVFLPCMLLCFIVRGNRCEVWFQSNIPLASPFSSVSKSQSENFPFVWDLITKHEPFFFYDAPVSPVRMLLL